MENGPKKKPEYWGLSKYITAVKVSPTPSSNIIQSQHQMKAQRLGQSVAEWTRSIFKITQSIPGWISMGCKGFIMFTESGGFRNRFHANLQFYKLYKCKRWKVRRSRANVKLWKVSNSKRFKVWLAEWFFLSPLPLYLPPPPPTWHPENCSAANAVSVFGGS